MPTNVGSVIISAIYELDKNSEKRMMQGVSTLQTEIRKNALGVDDLGKAFKGAFTEIGALIMGGEALKGLKEFTASSIELAGNLYEIQNVSDLVFGSSAKTIGDFARSSMDSLGLTEKSVKDYTGQLGMMLKGMGANEQQTIQMSEGLTRLTGDFSSMRGEKPDEVFQKIQSAMHGNEHALDTYGITMSETMMSQYAFSKGIVKTVESMSEMEKQTLRYNYIVEKSRGLQGDFARNQDSWVNSTRILSQNFAQLKTTLGEGFVVILSPLIKMLNELVMNLQVAAVSFRDFTYSLFNVKRPTEGASESASKAAAGYTDLSKSLLKAQGAVLSFDSVIQISQNKMPGQGYDLENLDPEKKSAKKDTSSPLDSIKNGLSNGLETIKSDIAEAVTRANFSLNSIGLDPATLTHLNQDFSTIVSTTEQIFSDLYPHLASYGGALFTALVDQTKSILKVAESIGESVIGGISKYLDQNSPRLTSSLEGILDNMKRSLGKATSIIGNIADLVSGFFKLDTTKQAIGDFIAIAMDMFLKPKELVTNMAADLLGAWDTMIANNKSGLSTLLSDVSDSLSKSLSLTKTFVQDTFDTVISTYTTYFKPALDNMEQGVSSVLGHVLDAYHKYVKPTLDKVVVDLTNLYKDSIKPFVDQLGETIGKLATFGSEIYKNVIAPVAGWLIDFLVPKLTKAFEIIWDVVKTVFGVIVDVAKGLLQELSGMIDFITGVFTGNWGLAWHGIEEIFGGVWSNIVTVAKGAVNLIIIALNTFLFAFNSMPEMLAKIPGMEWAVNLKIPEIPKLAKGGVVGSATQFIAGEAGSEAIVPLENSGVIDQFARKIADMIAQQGSTSNGGGGPVFHINGIPDEEVYLHDIVRKIMRVMEMEGIRLGGAVHG